MLGNNRAEIVRKELRKWLLSTSGSIIELDAECSNTWMLQVAFLPLD
jgi:hypothetical protein